MGEKLSPTKTKLTKEKRQQTKSNTSRTKTISEDTVEIFTCKIKETLIFESSHSTQKRANHLHHLTETKSSIKINEKITAALKNIYWILDVSAVYAAIFKRHNKHKWREDESSHNHIREKLHPGRERGEKHRETLRWWSREGDRRDTHTHTHT